MTGFSFIKNKKTIVLALSAVAAFIAAVFAVAFFTDRVNRTTTLKAASFDAEGYVIDVSAPDGYLTAGDAVDVVLEESNTKSKSISSQVTMTAVWESPVPDTYPWDEISITVGGDAISHSVNEDQTISFTLPNKDLPSGTSGEQSNLVVQLPSDLTATGKIKFSFEQIKLRSGEWAHDYAKDKLSALNFEIGATWNISKDQTTALGNPNRDIIALLATGTSTDDYSLEIIKNGSEDNTNNGQMMDWSAKEQTPWAKYDITDLTLSEGITTIGCYAFAGETGITNLSLPSTVNTIGSSAFEGSGLSGELVIPSTVMIIESLAFGELPDVNEITFEHGSDDSLILPDNTSEGEETSGAFYVTDYVKTTLNFNGNTVAKQYDWVADQRMKVGISEVTLTYENIQIGKTANPVLVINPSNYDKPQSVTYSVVDGKDYASVDSDTGVVTGIAPGSAKVQVAIVDANGETATATFTLSIGGTLSDVQIGDIIYLNENGSPVEYIVVNQGIPSDSSLYDASCDGTWLLRKDIHSNRAWTSTACKNYSESTTHTYLNTTFFELFDTNVQNSIKQVKLPYVTDYAYGTVASGENGMEARVFLLSGTELGYVHVSNYLPSGEGAELSYFSGCVDNGPDAKRIAYLNDTASIWWMRSPHCKSDYLYNSYCEYALYVNANGDWNEERAYTSHGIRPALILPGDAIINGDGTISVDHLILDSASVTKQPDKTEYMEGEDFDPTGMEVTITYKDGSTKTVSIDDLTIENGTNLSVDQTEISISYTDNGHTVDTTVPITVEKKPIAIEDAEIGSTVILDVDGKPTEFIIVHQGNPDNTLYDASCEGTWLLMKEIYDQRQWHSSDSNSYKASSMHSYLNSSFLSLFDSEIQTVIKQAKIPYVNGTYTSPVASGANGLSAKVFLLSGREIGWTPGSGIYAYVPADGAVLDYFDGLGGITIDDAKRVAYLDGTAFRWTLRSPYTKSYTASLAVSSTGGFNTPACGDVEGFRPALILPGDAIIKGDGTVDVSNVYFDIDSEPSQRGTLTYTGEEQTVSWDNYDRTQLTISGTTSATNAGTYSAIFTPKKHYRWRDGTTDAKEVEWAIEKAEGSLSLSATTIELDEGGTATIEVTRAGDGAISARSSEKSVATVAVNGTTITVTGVAAGEATITVSVAEGTNYKVPANANVATTINASGIAAGSLAVGSSVFLNVDGVRTEFMVVNQGNPDSSLYDASCDGTWLLMKDVYTTNNWANDVGGSGYAHNSYKESHVHSYLNDVLFGLFDPDVQSLIKQVKIPYVNGTGLAAGAVPSVGSNGLPSKVFLLSGYEVGWTQSDYTYFPADGACLSYFKETAKTDSKRIALLDGTATTWFLRSPMNNNQVYAFASSNNGSIYTAGTTESLGVRPAMIVPSDMRFAEDDITLPDLGDIAIGSSVYLNVDGVKTEFLVVNQGNPDSTLYDSSCDGTWLLMKDIYIDKVWRNGDLTYGDENKQSGYYYSDVRSYLRGTFLNYLDSDVQSTIVTATIPYYYGTPTMSDKIFILSMYEVGLGSTSYYYPYNPDGAPLSYFTSNATRIAYLDGNAHEWWTRTPILEYVRSDGRYGYSNTRYDSYGVRPAMIMPSNAKVKSDGSVDVSNLLKISTVSS